MNFILKNMHERLGPEDGVIYGPTNEKYNPVKIPPPENKEEPLRKKKKDDDRDKFTRREFGGLAVAGIMAVAFGGGAYKMATEIAKVAKEDDVQTNATPGQEQVNSQQLEDDAEEINDDDEVKLDEAMHSKEIVNFKKDRIELSLNTVKAIENNWKNRHDQGGDLHESFKDAFYNMGEWMFGFYDKGKWKPGLVEIFRDKGFANDLEFRLDNGKTVKCSKFIFLAIPESYWHMGVTSIAGANGPYQFTRATGKTRGLRIDNVIDQRMDPLDSASACADELADLIKRTKDENLALSGYNGNIINKYITNSRQADKDINYKDFIEFLEKKLNNLLDITKNRNDIEHKIAKNETIEKISRNYGINETQILRYNNLIGSSLKDGQVIKIPLASKNREKVFNYRARGFSENLNYPPKFHAIIELIEEGAVKSMAEPIKYREVTVMQNPVKEKLYSVRFGDSLTTIARELNLHPKQILKANPKLTKIRPGMTLKIPGKSVELINLQVLAKKYGMSLEDIKQLNPKFVPHFDKQSGKEKYYPIPNNEKIRIKTYV